jgi:hypothetical protein
MNRAKPSTAAIIDHSPRRETIMTVTRELARARSKFGAFASAHEGYAVILEELDELWTEVRKNPRKIYGDDPAGPSKHRAVMLAEAIQVAAMALRFAEDICGEEIR